MLEDVLGPGAAAALARTAGCPATRTLTSRPCGVRASSSNPAVRRRSLRAAALESGVPAGALTRAHVLMLDALVIGYHGQGPVPLPGGIRARRGYGRLTIASLNEEE